MADDIFRLLQMRGDGGLTIDAMSILLGKRLGAGIDREVYEFKPDPEKVIKIETGCGNFQNVIEMLTWHAATIYRKHPLSKHLAKVFQISTYGCWLIMERTYPPPANYRWPKKMPAALTDFKKGNYGLTKAGRLVCHDYGTNMLLDHGLSVRMRTADWWT